MKFWVYENLEILTKRRKTKKFQIVSFISRTYHRKNLEPGDNFVPLSAGYPKNSVSRNYLKKPFKKSILNENN